jgi:hypothetical protein
MDNKRLMTFWLDIKKHQRFKTKTASEKTSITQILTKAVDAYIGKSEDVAEIIAEKKGIIRDPELEAELSGEIKITGENGKKNLEKISTILSDNPKEKKIEALRTLIGGVPPNYSKENIQDIPKEDFPEEVSYEPDKQ